MGIIGGIILVASLVGAYMAYRAMQNLPTASNDSAPTAPQTEEGATIGVVFGTVKIDSPHVYWWGDVKGVDIKK